MTSYLPSNRLIQLNPPLTQTLQTCYIHPPSTKFVKEQRYVASTLYVPSQLNKALLKIFFLSCKTLTQCNTRIYFLPVFIRSSHLRLSSEWSLSCRLSPPALTSPWHVPRAPPNPSSLLSSHYWYQMMETYYDVPHHAKTLVPSPSCPSVSLNTLF